MSDADTIAAVRTMLALARVTLKLGLRNAAYRDVGLHLERLRHGRPKVEFVDLVLTCCELSVSRAYELMAIAKGKKSLASTRAATAARRRQHYSRKSKGSAERPATESGLLRPVTSKKAEQNQWQKT
jgi:hypothetical protein